MGRVAPVNREAALFPSNTMRPKSSTSMTSTSKSCGVHALPIVSRASFSGACDDRADAHAGSDAAALLIPVAARELSSVSSLPSRNSSNACATAFAALRCPDPTEACMTMMRGLGASAPSSTPGSTDSGCPSGDVGESSLLRGEPPSGADEMPSESARALCGCCGKADASISISGIIP